MDNTSSFTHNIDWLDMATSRQQACNIGQSITCPLRGGSRQYLRNLCLSLSTVYKVAQSEPNIFDQLKFQRCNPFYQREIRSHNTVVINKHFHYFNRIPIERRTDTFATELRLFPRSAVTSNGRPVLMPHDFRSFPCRDRQSHELKHKI